MVPLAKLFNFQKNTFAALVVLSAMSSLVYTRILSGSLRCILYFVFKQNHSQCLVRIYNHTAMREIPCYCFFLGQYRRVKIGLIAVVIDYLDCHRHIFDHECLLSVLKGANFILRKAFHYIKYVRENCHFLDQPPTPMSLRNIEMAP